LGKGTQLSKRLFVGNLSFDTDERKLEEAFAEWGGTGGAIPTGESGRPRGFGFVEVDEDKAQAAITAMDGQDLDGRSITVNEAKPREDRGGGFRNGGGGGGRGGYGGGGGGGRSRTPRW
jgi:RNA recognition motif-containing protein